MNVFLHAIRMPIKCRQSMHLRGFRLLITHSASCLGFDIRLPPITLWAIDGQSLPSSLSRELCTLAARDPQCRSS